MLRLRAAVARALLAKQVLVAEAAHAALAPVRGVVQVQLTLLLVLPMAIAHIILAAIPTDMITPYTMYSMRQACQLTKVCVA